MTTPDWRPAPALDPYSLRAAALWVSPPPRGYRSIPCDTCGHQTRLAVRDGMSIVLQQDIGCDLHLPPATVHEPQRMGEVIVFDRQGIPGPVFAFFGGDNPLGIVPPVYQVTDNTVPVRPGFDVSRIMAMSRLRAMRQMHGWGVPG